MTDINTRTRRPSPGEEAASGGAAARDGGETGPDPRLIDLVELLFFAYRDFTCEPDRVLAEIGFGRAHHRVLHFVNRHPGLRVADLLDILKITKQSLGRVLKQLVDEGYVTQEAGKKDRRERRLYPTAAGEALAERLAAPQMERIARSLAAAGDGAEDCVRQFLYRMTAEADRSHVSHLLESGRPPASERGDAS